MRQRLAMILSLMALMLAALPRAATAEEVVMGLSQSSVAITTTFSGSDILIFGAIKRETSIPQGDIEVIVTISGPSTPVTIRRKDKRMGIWLNTDMVHIDSAPSFYAVATSGPLAEVLSQTDDLRHRISVPLAIRSVGAPDTVGDAQSFTEALIRIRSASNLYHLQENDVAVQEQTLFRTSIRLPANLTEGDYATRIFLTRNGQVIDTYETVIDVRKVGLERFLYMMAHRQPVLYGLLSLVIAVIAGWGASAFFRVVLRQG